MPIGDTRIQNFGPTVSGPPVDRLLMISASANGKLLYFWADHPVLVAKKEGKPEKAVETPLMKQYYAIKAKYPDAILLFRVGDFYETFGEDAVKASGVLGIVLTKRANGAAAYIDLAGFPYHSLENYLPKLVCAGYRVAICEQLEDPKMTKTIVKRGVTELVTPGVALSDNVLDTRSNNFLCSICLGKHSTGVAFMDISTGEFLVGEGETDYVRNLLQSFEPSEVLYQKPQARQFEQLFGNQFHVFGLEEWIYDSDFANDLLLKQFGTANLKGFGIEGLGEGIRAAGAILHYLGEAQQTRLEHLNVISRLEKNDHVWLDNFTIRNLELLSSGAYKAITLFDVMDRTISPMGARLLRRWIALPLKDENVINERLNVVEHLVRHPELADEVRAALKEIGDLERLTAKVSTARITPRDLNQLRRALESVERVKTVLAQQSSPSLVALASQMDPCGPVIEKINAEVQEEAPTAVNKGNIFRKGIHPELDELRDIAYSGKDYLVKIQQREVERTGIPSLKISFNNVFGYYIEVTNTHKSKVPADWTRKQTLVNSERYITEELKEYESKILGAEEKILALESRLFEEIVTWLSGFIRVFQVNARTVSQVDCLQSFARTASENHYHRPEVNCGKSITILQSRHPVIEKALPPEQPFIPNDIHLDEEDQQIMIITGPNMSGKSAILRQTALVVLMAQMGSFVPANEARIGIVDKIFTRVGASDNLSQGESTFMVEMNETASILNNLSDRSLVLLDEIGRGTSTYDGISIAWSITEYLHNHPKCKAKTLFATHYHELNELAGYLPRVKNFHVAVQEQKNKVIFLRKLEPGGSEHSFGIHVARMAGMPKEIIRRADEVLKQLEDAHPSEQVQGKAKTIMEDNFQLSFFQLDDPVLLQIKDEIENLDINTLTPVEALMKLNEIRKIMGLKN